MIKKSFCCILLTFGIVCSNYVFAIEDKEISNTAYLTAHDIQKVVIGRSFSNCKTTKLSDKYIGLKTCQNANVSDFYYMATGFFHYSATQLLSKRVMKFVNKAGIKCSIAYREKMTSFGLNASF